MKKLYVDIDAVFTLSNSNSSIEFLFEKDVIHNLYLINQQLNYELVMVVNDANDRYVSTALSFLKNESILFQIERKAYENNNNIQHITKAGLTSWNDVFERLKTSSRKVSHTRNTNETQIEITLNPDGTGVYNISTGLGFFNHMLEQFSKHSLIDVSLTVKGDLHIDEHHTIEDVAIALGEAILKAVGDKKGIQRYGFLLPMDDCLAQVAVDFGGRSWLVWEAEFKREKIGDVPTEMFYHFFKSFSDGAKCNLNIKAEGTNEHHKIEAVFKAFAKAVKMAIAVNYESNVLPTTKGLL